MSRVAAIGMFDGVHLGHRYLLDYMKSLAEEGTHPLAVTFSNHPLEVVNPGVAPALLTSAEEKKRRLESAGAEVAMLDFDDRLRNMSASEFIAELRDRFGVGRLVMGFNNRFGHDRSLSFDDYCRIGRDLGVEVVKAPEYRPDDSGGVSSTIIRNLISEGAIRDANRLLGYDYQVAGEVVGGNRIGRTIGFPTANLQPTDPRKLIPAPGVYAARAMTPSGRRFPAMVNIGHRPTVDNTPELRIEAYLHGFEGDLYGQSLTLEFTRRLRDERRFDSLDALRAQLAADLRNLVTKDE